MILKNHVQLANPPARRKPGDQSVMSLIGLLWWWGSLMACLQDWCPSHWWYFWSNSNFYKNYWPHRLYKTDRITTKSCTYQDSTAVLVCVTIHCDWIYIKGNIHKHIINFTNQFIFYKWDGYLGWPAGDYMVLVLLHHISNHFIRPQIFLFQSHSTNHCVKIRLFC